MFIAGIILTGIGGLFLLLGIIFIPVGKSIYKCTARTQGKIIGMCRNAYSFNHGGTGGYDMYINTGGNDIASGTSCPIFTYWVNGAEYRRASNTSYSIGHIKNLITSGKILDVYYNPQNPTEASLQSRSPLLVIGTVFFFAGAGLFALGIIFLIAYNMI